MGKYTLNYEAEERRRRFENVKLVISQIDTAQMTCKIKNYAERYDLAPKFVYNKILRDNVFANQFSKDTSKQTFHQAFASDFISKLPNVHNFEMLPQGGANAQYVEDGVVVLGSEITVPTTKSIDFYWEITTAKGRLIKCYASHKHTQSNGGAQDNQFNDVIEYQRQAKLSTDTSKLFFSITDGAYYLSRYTRIRDKSINLNKIEYLNTYYRGQQNLATNSNNLYEELQKVIEAN